MKVQNILAHNKIIFIPTWRKEDLLKKLEKAARELQMYHPRWHPLWSEHRDETVGQYVGLTSGVCGLPNPYCCILGIFLDLLGLEANGLAAE